MKLEITPAVSASALQTCEGRLTLTSGTPVTTVDVTGATTIYFTPYKGDRVYLYNGASWNLYSFSELSLALGTLTNALPYDVFLYDNAGTLTLELLAWTNGTTRATALVTQNGVLCKTGALTRRYLGTFYTTATTTTEDSATKRLLWNYYNRVPRKLVKTESTTSWTYGTAAWRSLNNSTANRVEVVLGWAEEPVQLEARILSNSPLANEYGSIGIDVDGTTTNDADTTEIGIGPAGFHPSFSDIISYPGVGYHFYQITEYANTVTNITFYGTSGVLRKNGMWGYVNS